MNHQSQTKYSCWNKVPLGQRELEVGEEHQEVEEEDPVAPRDQLLHQEVLMLLLLELTLDMGHQEDLEDLLVGMREIQESWNRNKNKLSSRLVAFPALLS